MRPRGWQKPSLLVVVAGGCRGFLLPCVQNSVSILIRKFIYVMIFCVSNLYALTLWLDYDFSHVYHSETVNVCVDSSCRSLSGGLRHLCHDRSSPGREACGHVGGRSRVRCSWWQEGVEVSLFRVCKIGHLFRLKINSCHDRCV